MQFILPAHAATETSALLDSPTNLEIDSSAKQGPPACEAENPAFDPKLGRSFLLDQKKERNNPHLVVGGYSKAQGLVAGYQSNKGKRIMFSAAFPKAGGIYAQIWHFDGDKQKFVPVFRKSNLARTSGEKVRDISVGGVDVANFMKGEIGKRKNEHQAQNLAKLVEFLDSDLGDAILEATPALYAKLDSLASTEPEVAKLKSPFGAVALMLQLGTKRFKGFEHADKVLGLEKSKVMKAACAGDASCRFRGNGYIIHSYGLFDPLSKHKGLPMLHSAGVAREGMSFAKCPGNANKLAQVKGGETQSFVRGSGKPTIMQMLTTPAACRDNDDCFGYCGLDCFTPGNISSPACEGHDMCVCQFGHVACLTSPPEGCGAGDVMGIVCASFTEAALSWFEGVGNLVFDLISDFFDYFGDLFGDWFDDYFDPDDYGCSNDPMDDCNSP